MKWSDKAWEQASRIYGKILELPFIVRLSDGSLDREIFDYYICQDILYLKEFSRSMTAMSSRFSDEGLKKRFLSYAMENLEAEQTLHEFYSGNEPESAEPSPTCMLCSSHLYSQVMTAPLEVAAASVLPCFLIYTEVGLHIAAHSLRTGNPYRKWIETYSEDGFDTSTKAIRALCDTMAASASEDVVKLMTDAFVTGVKLEWMFWNSAYNMEKWEI